MSHIPHDLHEDFPAAAGKIDALKEADAHFARLVDDYQAVNHEVYAAETNTHPTDEAHEAELRRKRMHLKDEIGRMLAEA